MNNCIICKKKLDKNQKKCCSIECRNEYSKQYNIGKPSKFKGIKNRWSQEQIKKISETQTKANIGIDDIATTRPDLIKYLCNKEDSYKYKSGSRKQIEVICPNCSTKRNIRIDTLSSRPFVCKKCSDKTSYPNKFMYALLQYFEIEFVAEYSPKWISPKRYDFYFIKNDRKYIVEMDGDWHYRDNQLSGRTSTESRKIDVYKDKTAKQKGINVIRIHCYPTTFTHVKEVIIKSELNKILDLAEVDWEYVNEHALDNRIKIACNLWNSGLKSSFEIGKKMRIAPQTVVIYLKQGTELKWCDYDAKVIKNQALLKANKTMQKKTSKQIRCIETNQIFDSIRDCIRKSEEIFGFKLNRTSLSQACNGKLKTSGGYHWEFISKNKD